MPANVTVSPRELAECIVYALRANKPALIVGAPGCGKSEIASQAISEWDSAAEVIMIPGVSLLPTDPKGLGMPNTDRTAAVWLLYDWALRLLDANQPLVLSIEDVGQASVMAQACLMPIIQARMIGGQRISDQVRFVFTSNRREDKAGVNAVIEPLKNRCLIFELATAIEDWCRYYAIPRRLPQPIIDFYRAFPRHLQNFAASADITNSPTARQARAVADIYRQDPPRRLWPALYSAAIGQPAMLDLIAFLDLYGQLPNLDEVIMSPATAPLPDLAKPSYIYATIGGLVQRTTPANFDRILAYIERLRDEEMQAYYIDCACADPVDAQGRPVLDASTRQPRRNPLKSTQAFIAWASKHGWMYS